MTFMDIHFPLLTAEAAAHLNWWEHLGMVVERYDQDFLDKYPNLWGFIRAFWKVIFGIAATIVLLFSNPVRIGTFLFSNTIAVLNLFLRRQALQQLVNEGKIFMPARVKTAAEFDAASSQRGQRLRLYRDAISGQRIGLQGPYAVMLLVEIYFFNPHFLQLRGALKDAIREWDEMEEHVRDVTYRLSQEVDGIMSPHKPELAALVSAIDIAEEIHGNALGELKGRKTLFGYFGLKPKEWRAWREVKRCRKAYERKKREIARSTAPHQYRCDAHLRAPLLELDAIERFKVIPLAERFQADWRSILTTVQIGRTIRKLMADTPESARARKALKLEDLPREREEIFAHVHKALDNTIAFSPISPLEEWFEAFLRKHLLENIDNLEKIGTDTRVEARWLNSLVPPGSQGLVLKEFPHNGLPHR